MSEWTTEQVKAYERFIKARDKVGVVRTQGYSKRKWVRQADVVCSVDIAGINHPLFEQNDDWLEYKDASLLWWAVEPEFRKTERMSAIRGDYGTSDNWEEGTIRIRDTYSIINEEEQQQ